MMKRKILKAFVVCICYVLFFYSNTAFGIDWEQWRITRDEQESSSGSERPAPRQEREDTRKREAFKLNKKGNLAYKAGNWKEAIDYYEKALRKFPNDMLIRQNLTTAQNALNREGALALKPGNDPAMAAGSPIGQELTEHAQIRRFSEEAKYAGMDSREFVLLASQYPDHKKIQGYLRSLKAKQEAMTKLEDEMRKFNENRDSLNINEQQAKREVQRALAELAALGIPAGDSLDEWLNREKSASQVASKGAEEVITERAIDFVVAIFPKLERTVVTLNWIEKGKHLCRYYEALFRYRSSPAVNNFLRSEASAVEYQSVAFY